MTGVQVIRTAAGISRRFAQLASDGGSAHQGGDAVISASPVRCFENGQPGRRDFEVVNGEKQETWEYTCFNGVYLLTFHEGILSEITSQRLADRARTDQRDP